MKIRQDFVTNSSSTSFLISIKGEFTFDNFLKGLRMNRDCELVEIIERFFNVINCNKQDIECDDIDDVTEFENLDDKYSYCCAGYSEKIEKVKELLADKRKVYYGRCEDQGVEIEEIFLSNYNYEISNKDFYFDFGNSFF